jgi:hypothetical protein
MCSQTHRACIPRPQLFLSPRATSRGSSACVTALTDFRLRGHGRAPIGMDGELVGGHVLLANGLAQRSLGQFSRPARSWPDGWLGGAAGGPRARRAAGGTWRHRAQLATVIQQAGVEAGWCLVHGALLVQAADDFGPFALAQRPRLRWPSSRWRSEAGSVDGVGSRSRGINPGPHTRPACRSLAPTHQWLHRPSLRLAWRRLRVGRGDCSSSAETFPCASITRRALARSGSAARLPPQPDRWPPSSSSPSRNLVA